ncbi:hypothetical protein BpHYR1_042508 [Brachionus plicatilis]|uniref:Uncharacterized protein n=1 Tax=Brachionus plicatilis TaxID=10195 RepID=A0A3M7SX97_BRAPC|nr:hypothetical protein BpHYR1_042508 [Brachionus plicatilis]
MVVAFSIQDTVSNRIRKLNTFGNFEFFDGATTLVALKLAKPIDISLILGLLTILVDISFLIEVSFKRFDDSDERRVDNCEDLVVSSPVCIVSDLVSSKFSTK